MTLLSRYLLRNNLFLLLSLLLVGTGLYVLTDLFERLDVFLEASFGFVNIAMYYAIKIPLIIGQILPAVFLLAVIVQFSLMAKARELVALQSGGVPPFAFLRFVILCGLFWGAAQLALSQFLGIEGDRLAARIWREQVRGNEARETRMHGLWFVEKNYVVHLGVANPVSGAGTGFLAYQLSEDDKRLLQMIRAESFTAKDKVWRLHNATVITPENYGYESRDEMIMPLAQDISAFLAIDPGTRPTHLPLWNLRKAIADLETSGSNVEVLRTTLYARFAYAASLVVMGVIGLAIILWRSNVYLAVAVGLLITFIFYASTTLFVSLGERGVVPPLVGAWLPACVFFLISLGAVVAHIRPRLGRGG